ncbi:DNA replication/repair protein RecF [Govanella unica]|nr:DNA replication/repair protein RecF [Govania unica]
MAYAATRLVLTDFRNHVRTALGMTAAPVVLTGDNGAGKTNLLEALSYLAPGRGLRGARLPDITRIGARAWGVAATILGPDGSTDVGTGIEGRAPGAEDEGAAERRIVQIEGQTVTGPAALAEVLKLSWLTPQMDRLFIEGPSGRRRFFDRLVFNFHPAHGRAVAAYERVLRERNRLLSEGRADPQWLTALELQIAEHGVAVAAARLDSLGRLQAAVDLKHSAFPAADLELRGTVEDDLKTMPAVEAEDRFKLRLRDARARDAASGRSGDGPHVTDLKVRHRPKDMPAELCSTGEQKALLIGIVMGAARLTQAETGTAPLLLLDEVAAHLDSERRAALFEEILALGAQAFMTGTDHALFTPFGTEAQYFTIRAGTIVN